MANTMKKVDAVVVGFGWAGSIMAKELTEAGLNVVVLERGPHRDTYPDGAYPQVIDELTYNIRRKLFQDLSKSTVTIRHNASQTALPYRQLAAFLPGTGTGGAGLHWSGVHFRIDPMELRMRSHYEERYGKNFIPEGMTIQDFGVTYEELEPYFDKAEKVFGTSGTPWSVKGKVVGQGKGAIRLRRIAQITSHCLRRSAPSQHKCLLKQLNLWAIILMICHRQTPLVHIPIPMVLRWGHVISADSVAAMHVTCIPKPLRTLTCGQRCAKNLSLSCVPTHMCCALI